MTKAKSMRATYIAARFLNNIPNDEPYESFAVRNGLPRSLTVKKLCEKDDIKCGLLYRIAKAFGYQIIVYNPNPPKDMEKMYIIGEAKCPIAPKEHKGYYHIRRDEYTNTIYRVARKYKKQKRVSRIFRQVTQ